MFFVPFLLMIITLIFKLLSTSQKNFNFGLFLTRHREAVIKTATIIAAIEMAAVHF